MDGKAADPGEGVRGWLPDEAAAIVGGEEDPRVGADENPTREFGVSDDGVDMRLARETAGLGQWKATPSLRLFF